MHDQTTPEPYRVYSSTDNRYLHRNEYTYQGEKLYRWEGNPGDYGPMKHGQAIPVSKLVKLDHTYLTEEWMGQPDREDEQIYEGDVLLMPDGSLVEMVAKPVMAFKVLLGPDPSMPFNQSRILESVKVGHKSQPLDVLQAEAEDVIASAAARQEGR